MTDEGQTARHGYIRARVPTDPRARAVRLGAAGDRGRRPAGLRGRAAVPAPRLTSSGLLLAAGRGSPGSAGSGVVPGVAADRGTATIRDKLGHCLHGFFTSPPRVSSPSP